MKKPILLHSLWILSLCFTMSSCKKNLVEVNEPPVMEWKMKKQADAGREGAPMMDVMRGNLQLSLEHYNALINGEWLETLQTGDHDFVAVATVAEPAAPDPYTNPCDQDWSDFRAYLSFNAVLFQNWANTHCRPMIGCWSGECISITFAIRPNNGCENLPPYEAQMPIFQF